MTVFDIDPNVVRPGWTPLIITIVLAAAMVFLYRSMRHQFSRIQAPKRETPPIPGPDDQVEATSSEDQRSRAPGSPPAEP